MAFTDGLTVVVGNPTKASEYNSVADNTEWLRALGDAGHYFDVTTGDGKHRGIFSAPLILQSGASLFAGIWIDNTDANNIVLRVKTATSAAGVVGSSIADADSKVIQMAATGTAPAGF